MACKKFLTLNNGIRMPALGIGTWRAPDEEVVKALDVALSVGYRHIDAAPVYLNESVIGKLFDKWINAKDLNRDELFVTTKLPPPGNRPSSVENYLRHSLNDLKLKYVDMYLIHTPFTVPEMLNNDFQRESNGEIKVDNDSDLIETWKKMEEMVEMGLTKSIGVSNFNKDQIQRILDNSKIKPANLQIELHILLQQHDLVDFCKKNNIIVTAYSPLGSKGIEQLDKLAGIERQLPDLFENPVIKKIAERLNKTPAQIMLKWILERGVAAIPKSTNINRLRENINLFNFELTKDDMLAINELDQGLRICDFGFLKGVNKHKEFPW